MNSKQFVDLETFARRVFHNAIIKVYEKAIKDDSYLIIGDHQGNPVKIYPARSQNLTEKQKLENKTLVSSR